MYDSRIGRFLSEDPTDDDLQNRYRYVRNSPTNATDPSGMAPINAGGNRANPTRREGFDAKVTVEVNRDQNYWDTWLSNMPSNDFGQCSRNASGMLIGSGYTNYGSTQIVLKGRWTCNTITGQLGNTGGTMVVNFSGDTGKYRVKLAITGKVQNLTNKQGAKAAAKFVLGQSLEGRTISSSDPSFVDRQIAISTHDARLPTSISQYVIIEVDISPEFANKNIEIFRYEPTMNIPWGDFETTGTLEASGSIRITEVTKL